MPFVVPFRRPDLIGREASLEALHGRLGAGDVALTPALTGRAGIGKARQAAVHAPECAASYEGGVSRQKRADPRPKALLDQVADAFARELGLTTVRPATSSTQPRAPRSACRRCS